SVFFAAGPLRSAIFFWISAICFSRSAICLALGSTGSWAAAVRNSPQAATRAAHRARKGDRVTVGLRVAGQAGAGVGPGRMGMRRRGRALPGGEMVRHRGPGGATRGAQVVRV